MGGLTGPAAPGGRPADGQARDLGRNPVRRDSAKRRAVRGGAQRAETAPPLPGWERRDPDEHGAPRRLGEAPNPDGRRRRGSRRAPGAVCSCRRAPADLLCIAPCARPPPGLRMRGDAEGIAP